MMLEAGQNEARSLAYIAEAKKLIPEQADPVRHEHACSLRSHGRAAGDRGRRRHDHHARRTTRSSSSKALNTPRTLLNDTLAKNPKKATVEAVGEKKVYSDGTRVVEMYHISPAPHSNGLLVAFIPKEKVLFQGDFSLPAAGSRRTITSRRWCRCSRSSISTSIATSTSTPPRLRRPRRTSGRPSGSNQKISRTNGGPVAAAVGPC